MLCKLVRYKRVYPREDKIYYRFFLNLAQKEKEVRNKRMNLLLRGEECGCDICNSSTAP